MDLVGKKGRSKWEVEIEEETLPHVSVVEREKLPLWGRRDQHVCSAVRPLRSPGDTPHKNLTYVQTENCSFIYLLVSVPLTKSFRKIIPVYDFQ